MNILAITYNNYLIIVNSINKPFVKDYQKDYNQIQFFRKYFDSIKELNSLSFNSSKEFIDKFTGLPNYYEEIKNKKQYNNIMKYILLNMLKAYNYFYEFKRMYDYLNNLNNSLNSFIEKYGTIEKYNYYSSCNQNIWHYSLNNFNCDFSDFIKDCKNKFKNFSDNNYYTMIFYPICYNKNENNIEFDLYYNMLSYQ